MSDGKSPATISQSFAAAKSVQTSPSKLSPERVGEISAKASSLMEKAEMHFEQHRQLWTNRQYAQLLAGDGARMTLRPSGMIDDRKAHLMRAADHLVLQRQSARVNRINRAAEKMLAGGKDVNRSGEIGR